MKGKSDKFGETVKAKQDDIHVAKEWLICNIDCSDTKQDQ